jgi:hypothetical protein
MTEHQRFAAVPLISSKERLEFPKHLDRQILQQMFKEVRHVDPVCYSLIERYKSSDLSFHLHFSGESVDQLCIILRRGGIQPAGAIDLNLRQKNPPVFVDIAEFMQSPEIAFESITPKVVWLQSVDDCNHHVGKPREIPSPECIREAVWRFTDRECVSFVGYTIRSKAKFPDKIIQRRSEVLQTISQQEWDVWWKMRAVESPYTREICARIEVHHGFAKVAVKVPLDSGYQRVSMHLGPDDFVPNPI